MEKSKNKFVLLTIIERQTRYAIVPNIASKVANVVNNALSSIRNISSNKFSQVFKTITGDNASEFDDLFPRKILDYKTHEEVFKAQLDQIYTT